MPNYKLLLNLEEHIEGGYFGVTFKSDDKVIPLNPRYASKRPRDDEHKSEAQAAIIRSAGTSIYFLLEEDDFSAWHTVMSDELWHYYDGGSPINIHVLDKNGGLKTHILGNPHITPNASFQIVVQAGQWFAAEVRDKTSYALVGCTVSPGFEYHDFELGKRDDLVKAFPDHTVVIDKFIRPHGWKRKQTTLDHSSKVKRILPDPQEYIKSLNLQAHVEGGYFCAFYKSEDEVSPLKPSYVFVTLENQNKQKSHQTSVTRSAGTSIYFLLNKEDFSAWHKLKSDEIWHYYDGGSPIDVHVIEKSGALKTYMLGNPSEIPNSSFQVVIKADQWFAAEVKDKTSYGLVGCTVSPGFEYQDFELDNEKQLARLYPQHESIIGRFTRASNKHEDLVANESTSRSWSTTALKVAVGAITAGLGLSIAYKLLGGSNQVEQLGDVPYKLKM